MGKSKKKNKIGRNDPCHCGSGKKYKRCHGFAPNQFSDNHAQSLSQEEINRQLSLLQAKQKQREKQQGLGRPIISEVFKGYRFVAVGSRLHYSDKWKTFHDFLFDYIKIMIGSEWGNNELRKPFEERHPIIQWYDLVCKHQQQYVENPGAIHTAPMTGAVSAYLGLSYNLYLLAHNAEIQSRLISRLKNNKQFQSAYYETYVAAAFIKAGFELEFENEDDSSTSHCEFSATCNKSGNKYSIEAKSREPGKPHARIGNQLHEALKKNAKYRRIVFIDLNVPSEVSGERNAAWMDEALGSLREKESTLTIAGIPAPEAYIFVTNHTYLFNLRSDNFHSAVLIEGFKIPDFKGGGVCKSIREALKLREKHSDVLQLISSLQDHYEIPCTFDGEIPEFAFNETTPRLRIGQRYAIPDSTGKEVVGILTTATVLEDEKSILGGYQLENGTSILAKCPITDGELEAYRRYPDTFFSVYHRQGKKLKPGDLLGLYDFFFEAYRNTPKEKLLEFLKSHPDYDRLKNETQEELAVTYCERMTYAADATVNQPKTKNEASE